MPYIKSLDGLRGVAILLVLLRHAADHTPMLRSTSEAYVHAILQYGWIGVDCFFVLSGFLITSILQADRGNAANVYFKSFYARRALRIFPIYYLLLAVLFASTFSVGYPSQEWLALATYTHNFYLYFEPSQLGHYVGHMWSLAVEEHFYLLWPVAVYFLAPRQAVRLIGILLLATVALRIGLVFSGNKHLIYTNTFTRADSLLAGALLAYVRSTGQPFSYGAFVRHRRVLLWTATGLLLLAQLAFNVNTNNDFNFTLGFTILALVFVCVLSNALEAGSAIQALLEQSWLCALGRISYGAYLFHIPVYSVLSNNVFVRIDSWTRGWYIVDVLTFLICGAVVVFALAALSFRYIEQPILARRPNYSARAIIQSPVS